jgi:hypothetical protein
MKNVEFEFCTLSCRDGDLETEQQVENTSIDLVAPSWHVSQAYPMLEVLSYGVDRFNTVHLLQDDRQ